MDPELWNKVEQEYKKGKFDQNEWDKVFSDMTALRANVDANFESLEHTDEVKPEKEDSPQSSSQSSSLVSPSGSQISPTLGGKRQRVSAQERRRRNTEASQRFRLRKKLREKEMESELLRLKKIVQRQEDEILRLRTENDQLRDRVRM